MSGRPALALLRSWLRLVAVTSREAGRALADPEVARTLGQERAEDVALRLRHLLEEARSLLDELGPPGEKTDAEASDRKTMAAGRG